jgi:F-type H+-transporting ATPase subunit delta
MAERTTVARPYAKAAFQFAEETASHQQWSEMLSFAAAAMTEEALARYLDNPRLTAAERADVFRQIGEAQLSEEVIRFIALLAQNKRIEALPEIARQFEELRAQSEQRVDVQVISAFPLSTEQSGKIAESIKRRLKCNVNLNVSEDRGLIGGVIIRTNDMVIDASVRGKLAKLADIMNS